MRKATKTIISFAVILIAGLNFIVPAFAQDPFTAIAVGGFSGASGAGLFSSMAAGSGIDIGWGNNSIDQMDAFWDELNSDHVYFSGEKHEATNVDEDIYDYIQVDIGDWLQAQRDFIDEFVTSYNVQDHDTDSTNTGWSYHGVPIDQTTKKSDVIYSGSVAAGQTLFLGSSSLGMELIGQDNGVVAIKVFVDNSIKINTGWINNPQITVEMWFEYNWNLGGVIVSIGGNYGYCGPLVNSATVNWSSDVVNTSVYDGWESAKVKIPSSISQLQTGWTLTDFLNELDRIWTGAGEDNIIIENGGDVPPIPPVPVPDTPLGDVPFDDWVDLWGQGIYEQLENQSDALDFIGSNGEDTIEELENIDSNLGDLNQTAESIDTNIGIGNGLLGGIKSAAESAVEYLEGIAEHVEELVEEIVEGTETLIAGILNQIPHVFGVIFGPIKQASTIWHYVVEWIQSISAPMSWMWSMASGTSYNIILPVYASLAAAVVLAFYKRFGK